jgi:hypothetical protein
MNTLRYLALGLVTFSTFGARAVLAQGPVPCANTPMVVLYEHPNFQGGYVIVSLGEDIHSLSARSFNDRASSIKAYIPPGRSFTLYEHLGRGNNLLLRPGYWEFPDLRREGLNDKITSGYWN